MSKFIFIIFNIVILVYILDIYGNVHELKELSSRNSVSQIQETDFVPDAKYLSELINIYRAESNKNKLEKHYGLCGVAIERLSDLEGGFSHEGFVIKSDFYMDSLGFNSMGENLFQGKNISEENILNMWINSPAHKEILDANFNYQCVVCDKNHCVSMFGNTK